MSEAKTTSTQAAQEEENMKPSSLNDMMENMLQGQAGPQHTHLVQDTQAERKQEELSIWE